MKIFIVMFTLIQALTVHAGQANLIELDDEFVGEQKFNKTIYVPKEKRKQYEIRFNKAGMVLDSNGQLFDTRLLPLGLAMFVYSKEGKIYISKRRSRLKFDHSSLVGGEDVIVAGTINIKRGKINYITDLSPMYVASSKGNLKSAIYRLKVMGLYTKGMRAFFKSDL